MTSNDRSIVGLVAVAHAMVHTYELSIPIFMTAWIAEFSVSTRELGLMVGVGYALFGLGAIPGGVLSDRLGSRGLIAVCLAGMGGSFALLSFTSGPWTLTAAVAVWGVAASVYHPAGLALISKGVVQRGRALALHGMAGNLGIAFGPLLAAVLLVGLGDWRWAALALALPAAGATAYALSSSFDETAAERALQGAEDDTSGDPTSGDPTSGDPTSGASAREGSSIITTSRLLFASAFAVVFAIVMLSGLYYRGVLTFLPGLLNDLVAFALPLNLEPGRYVYAGLLMVGMLGQYAGGRLTERYPTEICMAAALGLLSVIALAFLPVVRMGTTALLAGSAVLGFFLFLVQPLYQATVAEYTPSDARGLSYGFTYLGVFGVGAVGAPIAGWLLDVATPFVLFAVLSGIAGTAALLSAGLVRRARRARKGREQPAASLEASPDR